MDAEPKEITDDDLVDDDFWTQKVFQMGGTSKKKQDIFSSFQEDQGGRLQLRIGIVRFELLLTEQKKAKDERQRETTFGTPVSRYRIDSIQPYLERIGDMGEQPTEEETCQMNRDRKSPLSLDGRLSISRIFHTVRGVEFASKRQEKAATAR